MAVELNRANAILFQIRLFVDSKSHELIYHAIFESYLYYCFLI